LLQGYDGTGPVVVADMKTTTSYNIMGPASTQFFTLIFMEDECPNDPDKTEPGICGCGVADTDADQDGVPACNDCDDTDITTYPGAQEVCDGEDNDCDYQVDEGLEQPCSTACGTGTEICKNGQWVNCTAPAVEEEICDGYDNDCDNQVDEDLVQYCTSLCGTGTETCENGQWVNCTAPIPPCEGEVSVEMNLSKGWSMISLPLIPTKALVSDLFPGIVVAYGFDNEIGYFRLEEGVEMKTGFGYWILLNEDQDFVITGQPFQSYNYLRYEDGWDMIGGCSSDAKAIADNCVISVIYKFTQELGYQRLHEAESLLPGQAYWILLREVVGQCDLTVEITDL
jgi:hypothetical protein